MIFGQLLPDIDQSLLCPSFHMLWPSLSKALYDTPVTRLLICTAPCFLWRSSAFASFSHLPTHAVHVFFVSGPFSAHQLPQRIFCSKTCSNHQFTSCGLSACSSPEALAPPPTLSRLDCSQLSLSTWCFPVLLVADPLRISTFAAMILHVTLSLLLSVATSCDCKRFLSVTLRGPLHATVPFHVATVSPVADFLVQMQPAIPAHTNINAERCHLRPVQSDRCFDLLPSGLSWPCHSLF